MVTGISKNVLQTDFKVQVERWEAIHQNVMMMDELLIVAVQYLQRVLSDIKLATIDLMMSINGNFVCSFWLFC